MFLLPCIKTMLTFLGLHAKTLTQEAPGSTSKQHRNEPHPFQIKPVTHWGAGAVTAGLGPSPAVNLPSLPITKNTTLPLSLFGSYKTCFTVLGIELDF